MSTNEQFKDASDEETLKMDETEGKTDPTEYTEGGDIGDEQLPAGEIKTDKRVWHYDASKTRLADLPKKVKDFVAGL